MRGNPCYLRLADLAAACAGANRHAEFARGELTDFLGVHRSTVDRAIETAVEYGLLDEASHRRCLVLPENVFVMHAGTGTPADQEARRRAPCTTCHTGPARAATCPHPWRERYTKDGRCQSCYRNGFEHVEVIEDNGDDPQLVGPDEDDWNSIFEHEPVSI